MTRSRILLSATALCVAAAVTVGCGKHVPQPADGGPPPTPEYRLKPLAGRTFGNCSPGELQSLLAPYKRPEMMALGGSVFNGISSLQINWWLADWSPTAQVARALNNVPSGPIPGFNLPSYPDYGARPYDPDTFRLGLDLETTNLKGLPEAVRRQGKLMTSFETHKPADGRPFNDNLAFGGAAIEDLLYGTPTDYRRRLRAISMRAGKTYGELREDAIKVDGMIAAGRAAAPLIPIFYAENSSFVLDPTHNACISEMTPLDQTLLRQPKRLLLGVGSNSGLFTFLINGQPVDEVCRDSSFTFGADVVEWTRYVSILETAEREFLTNMQKLFDRLLAEGTGIERVYVLGQLRPSSVANLKPIGAVYPGLGKYYDQYEIDFAPTGSRIVSGALVRQADELNHRINLALKAKVEALNGRTRTRFVFVDLEPISDRSDFKHTGKRDQQYIVTGRDLNGLTHEVPLDNRTLEFYRHEERLADGTSAGQRLRQGGLFSIDNLHPTVVGYSALANGILDAIRDEEKFAFAPGAREIVREQALYAHYSENDGNVLRRVDRTMASRRDWLQGAFDLAATVLRTRQLDCLPQRRTGDGK